MSKQELRMVLVKRIVVSVNYPRDRQQTTIDALKTSIKEYGLRNPIRVCETGIPDVWELVSGRQRLGAFEEMGEERIPCIIYDRESGADIVKTYAFLHEGISRESH